MSEHKVIIYPSIEGQIMKNITTGNMVVLSGRRIYRGLTNDYLCELMDNTWLPSGNLRFTRGIKWTS